MCQPSLSVWFVCRLCRGSFGQVDAFIEHKKQKHFNEFQNTTSIVFEERELGLLYPVITNNGDHHLVDEINEPPIKIEVNLDDPVVPFISETTDQSTLHLFELKSELITDESEINPDDENSSFGLAQPEPSPYVLLKRLTSEEIQRARFPQRHSTNLKCEQKLFADNSEPRDSLGADSNTSDHNAVEKSNEIQPTATVEHDLEFECKLCSKQLESDGQLKVHMGICALNHEDRNRFCVICNRKLCTTQSLKQHRLRFHGTEEEKSSLFKFKCHVCPKQYREAVHLRFHLEWHKKKKQRLETSTSKFHKCSHPNCGKEFCTNALLQKHISIVHLRLRPFSCHFPNCDKTFSQRANMERHFVMHTGDRPYKCPLDSCNHTFTFYSQRTRHYRAAHFI